MRHVESKDGPGHIEVTDVEMERRASHVGMSLDAIDAEAIAAERAIDAAMAYEPTQPDRDASAAATRNEMFTRDCA